MLKYFNSAYFSRTLILVSLAALMWLPAFIIPAKTTIAQNPAPLYQLFLFLTGGSIYLQLSIAFILTIVSALLLNQIVTEFGISEKISQQGTFVYLIFSGAMSCYTTMNVPVLISLPALLFLRTLFKMTEAKDPVPLAFNAALLLGIIALFYLPSLYLIVLLWVSMMIFRVGNWRNFAVTVIGLLLPFVFAFTWYFWNDQIPEAYTLLLSSLTFHFPDITAFSPGDMGIAPILLVFILVSAAQTNSRLMEKNIDIRQMLLVTIWFLAGGFVLILFFSESTADSLVLIVPASILFVSVVSETRNLKWFERAIRLLVLLALVNQYTHLFYAA